MIIQQESDCPDAALAQALADFEGEFTYPLGPDRSFRISHGNDYPRFFRAMGEGCSFVARDQGHVLGTLGIAICRLTLPSGEQRPVAYVGDLKVSRCARGRAVFWQLAQAAKTWASPQVDAAFGVVMDGTPLEPHNYTGRAGIPGFGRLGTLWVHQIQASPESDLSLDVFTADPARGRACYLRLSHGRYAHVSRVPAERSQMAPLWLVHPDGSACGRLEDTRRAKRLLDAESGVEMMSAHLACFAFSRPAAGVELIREALRLTRRRGLPSLFVAVAEQDMDSLAADMSDLDGQVAAASVYGTGLDAGRAWNISTSEI